MIVFKVTRKDHCKELERFFASEREAEDFVSMAKKHGDSAEYKVEKYEETRTLEEIIKEQVESDFNYFDENFEHKTESDFAPYGDTFARMPAEATEESESRCHEEFKDNFDATDFVCSSLAENELFLLMVENIMKGAL